MIDSTRVRRGRAAKIEVHVEDGTSQILIGEKARNWFKVAVGLMRNSRDHWVMADG
jgi:hypothetical protein